MNDINLIFMMYSVDAMNAIKIQYMKLIRNQIQIGYIMPKN